MDQAKASMIVNSVARALSSIHCYGRDADIIHCDAQLIQALDTANLKSGFVRRDIATIAEYSEDDAIRERAQDLLDRNPIDSFVTLMDSGLVWSELIKTAKELIEAGADVDERDENGKTALMKAAGGGAVELMRLLLDNGAQVDAKDSFDWTPLRAASHNGQLEAAEFLLENGADPNVLVMGKTVMASTFNLYKPSSDIMQLLKRYGGTM